MTPFLVGLGYKSRAGKDAAAWAIVDALRVRGIDARRYGFADALKAVCRVVHGMREKDAPLLQRVGVEYRDTSPTIWIDTVLATIAEDAPDVAILSDTRFKNEVAAVRASGGWYVRVTRPRRPATGRDDTHVSEIDLDGVAPDMEILNNGTTLASVPDAVALVVEAIVAKVRP